MDMRKALPINVYHTDRLSDCTNNGISSRYNSLLLLSEDGYMDVDLDNPPENLVVLGTIEYGGKCHKFIQPYAKVSRGYVGWMNGGNIAYTSDSRFPSEYPLCIYDRQEFQSHYDALSH